MGSNFLQPMFGYGGSVFQVAVLVLVCCYLSVDPSGIHLYLRWMVDSDVF